MPISAKLQKTPCPCGSTLLYDQCCHVFHSGTPAPIPLALMRSRYSAYVLRLEDYLLATWAPETRPEHLDLTDDKTRWLGLEIRSAPPTETDEGIVEFVARYKIGGRAHRLHEASRFCRHAEQWFYLDGEFPAVPARRIR